MQRRIQQFRVKLKDQITKIDADDKVGLRQGSSRPPVPHPARIPGTRPVSFENPSVKAITSAQLNAHKMEVSSPQSFGRIYYVEWRRRRKKRGKKRKKGSER